MANEEKEEKIEQKEKEEKETETKTVESKPVDEEIEKAEAVEETAQVEEETPAEVEAVHTDTESAKEAEGETSKVEVSTPKSEKKEKLAPTGKFKDLIKEIEGLSVADLAELVKALEDRFGVSTAAPVGAISAVPAAGGAPGGQEGQPESKATYTVVLTDAGAQKIAVIKAVREINQQLGLKEAKDLVEGAPKEVAKDLPAQEAEEAKKKIETAGAKVELK